MTVLSAVHAGVTYRSRNGAVDALRDISLAIAPGEFVVALGASGCGKSTLLGLYAGFIRPTSGQVLNGAEPVTGPGPDRAVVFQDDALMPWLSAADNVAFGLRLRGVGQAERSAVARDWLAQVGLAGFADHRIGEMSGGMRQRVGLARALAVGPRFLLMDEPLGALDELTRERMQMLLLHLWRREREGGAMGVFAITHSIEEALFLATEVVLMSPRPGRIVQRYRPPFAQAFLAGEPVRAIKRDPLFLAMREELAEAIFAEQDEGLAHG